MVFDSSLIAQPAVAWKQPGEKLDYAVDFSERLKNSTTITVESVTAVDLADDSPASIIATSPAPFIQTSSKILQFRVEGGDAGHQYKITVQAEGDDGQVAEFDIELNVVDF